MKVVKLLLFLLGLSSVGSVIATELFLLNKTGRPLYYKLQYRTIDQVFAMMFQSVRPKAQEWIRKRAQNKVKEGAILDNRILHAKSYLLSELLLKKDKDGKSLIRSIEGDQLVRNICETRRMEECEGIMFRFLRPRIYRGALIIGQEPTNQVTRPLVVVVTLDPGMARQGKVDYILTELSHTGGLFRKPKPFFYTLQGIATPTVLTTQ